ncbi:ArsR/SmtB family transcription factor [Catelliglobosispora koreensis]|uniref:ArsR/SmtB family transcription factor n=1 Tax=Catelliglobosispora koreensis TaxID=129052 RepID=UPI00037B30C7|nr:DUF5937 family protein [Catelliglobosispora koreensis]
MLTIAFSAGDVARIRFGFSCLWEVAASIRVLRDPGDHAVHLPWVTRARQQLDGQDLPLLDVLISSGKTYMPDFLTPAPLTLVPDLDDELDVLLNTPEELVKADLEHMGRPIPQIFLDDPRAGLAQVAAEIKTYWQLAIAAHWPRIRALLEAEVFYRARRLAEDGAEGLLNDLHQRVRWEEGTLSIAHRYCSGTTALEGAGLLLVPSAFVWPSVLSVSKAEQPQLAYPARGVATLWECPAEAPDALVAVIGKTRAQLLAALDAPVSTTDLARRTGLSAGGVSQQLNALRAAGLVTAHRSGHAVLNTRTAVAESLLAGAAF